MEKIIGGVPRKYRLPHENDLDALRERVQALEICSNGPLADCWRHDIEYLCWINCWEVPNV